MRNTDNLTFLSEIDDKSVAEFISGKDINSEKAKRVTASITRPRDLWLIAKMAKDARKELARKALDRLKSM